MQIVNGSLKSDYSENERHLGFGRINAAFNYIKHIVL